MNSEHNPCNIHLDIFYNILKSANDVRKAVEWIKACDREGEFEENKSITILFCDYYRENIISLSYSKMVKLFSNNRKIFYPLFNDDTFWLSKIKHDIKVKILEESGDESEKESEKISNFIQEFFWTACKFYPLYVPYIINNYDVDLEKGENFPLYTAIGEGNISIIKLLFDRGVDPQKYEDVIDGVKDVKTLKWIISDGRFIIKNNILSTIYDNYNIVKFLLEKTDSDPSYENNKAIGSASLGGHYDVVELLLNDPRVDPSDNYNKAIQNASEEGHHKIVELLLKDPRVDPSSRLGLKYEGDYDYENEMISSDGKDYALRIASLEGHDKVVKLLLSDQRVDPTTNNNEAVILAVRYNNINTINLLLNDKRVLKSIDIKKLNTFDYEVTRFVRRLLKRRYQIDEILDRLYNKKAKILFECWEDFIGRSEDDELNAETISQKFTVKRENNIIHVSAKLEEFSDRYKQQIRGYLLVNDKEIIVIFQSFPKSDVSIVHIKI